MQKEKESGIKYSKIENPLIKLLFSREFYISLIIPMFIGFLLSLVEEKRFIIFLSFLLGICSLPLIVIIKEIFKNNKDEIKDMA